MSMVQARFMLKNSATINLRSGLVLLLAEESQQRNTRNFDNQHHIDRKHPSVKRHALLQTETEWMDRLAE
jgi:hypothetical protein